jgi:hypothetical protein
MKEVTSLILNDPEELLSLACPSELSSWRLLFAKARSISSLLASRDQHPHEVLQTWSLALTALQVESQALLTNDIDEVLRRNGVVKQHSIQLWTTLALPNAPSTPHASLDIVVLCAWACSIYLRAMKPAASFFSTATSLVLSTANFDCVAPPFNASQHKKVYEVSQHLPPGFHPVHSIHVLSSMCPGVKLDDYVIVKELVLVTRALV